MNAFCVSQITKWVSLDCCNRLSVRSRRPLLWASPVSPVSTTSESQQATPLGAHVHAWQGSYLSVHFYTFAKSNCYNALKPT